MCGLSFKVYIGCLVFIGSNVYSNLVVEIAFVVFLDPCSSSSTGNF